MAHHNQYRHPKAHSVHKKTRRAIASGRLIKPKACSKCGRTDKPIQAHHEDYDKPFEVTWLCTGCHGDIHNEEKYGMIIRDEEARKEANHERYLRKKIRDYQRDPLGLKQAKPVLREHPKKIRKPKENQEQKSPQINYKRLCGR